MKKLIPVLLIIALSVVSLSSCQKKDSNLTTVRLSEVAHSIFYAPQYVAIELGYFEEEGLDLELVTSYGADKVMTALMSNEADIGFMGSESSIYVYAEGASDYVVNFAQLTQRAGNFLVSRTPQPDFTFDNLKNTSVLGGRTGGMPEMVFEYILKSKGINPETDLSIDKNIDFGLTAEAFMSGQGDYTVEFEPYATMLEGQGYGYIVASLGVESGYVPYTAYCAKSSYFADNAEVIEKFTRALQRGMDYVNTHTATEIANVIAPQFPDTSIDTIATIVERYNSQDTWNTNLIFTEESFTLLQDILISSGELNDYVPYDKLVNTEFASKVLTPEQ